MKRLRLIYKYIILIILLSMVNVITNKDHEDGDAINILEVQLQYEKNGENVVSAPIKGNYTWGETSDLKNLQLQWNLADFTKVEANIEDGKKQIYVKFSSDPQYSKVIKKSILAINSELVENEEVCSITIEDSQIAIMCQKGEAYQVLAEGDNWFGKWYFYIQ